MRPPVVAELLIEAVCPDADTREGVLGDLYEEHVARQARGDRRGATLWYWHQTLRSALSLARTSFRRASRGSLGMTIVAMLAGYLALMVLVMVTDFAIGWVITAIGGMSMAGTSIASLAVALGCGVGAGYVAALVGRAAPLTSALALGVASAVLGIVLLASGESGTPRWYQAGLIVVVLPTTFAGGVLRARRARRRF
jgi:hypothetical protein